MSRVRTNALVPGRQAGRFVRALITGAAGFVGRHLAAHSRALGDDVVPGSADVTDPESLNAELARHRPQIVYHLAGQSDVARSWTEPIRTLRANVEGTYNVLDASRRAGVDTVVAASSADVYGPIDESDLPIDEDAPLHPASPYAASKAAAEMMCVQATVGPGPPVIRVRAFNHLGPGQGSGFVASALAAQIADNERSGDSSIRVGNLEVRRDFTDVRDAARAYRLLALHGQAGEVYNICSGTDRPVRELADLLLARAERPMDLEPDTDRFRPLDIAVRRGNPTRLHSVTGWKPEIPLPVTLADLLDYWRARTGRADRDGRVGTSATVR